MKSHTGKSEVKITSQYYFKLDWNIMKFSIIWDHDFTIDQCSMEISQYLFGDLHYLHFD